MSEQAQDRWVSPWPLAGNSTIQMRRILDEVTSLRQAMLQEADFERSPSHLTTWLRRHAVARDQLVDAYMATGPEPERRQAIRDAMIQQAVIAVLSIEWLDEQPEGGRL